MASVAFLIAASLLARKESAVDRGSVLSAVVAIVAVAIVGSVGATLSVSDDELVDGDVVVDTRDSEYPDELEAETGPSAFYVDNHDIFRHTFVIEGTDVDVEVPASTARRVEVDLDPGTYRYYCSVAGHESMEGTIVVSG